MAALSVENLTVSLRLGTRWHDAVRGLSFSVGRGETLALVGESGCGKSLTAMAIMRLLPPVGRISSGEIRLGSEAIARLPEAEMAKVRGRRIGMIFQEPMTSLNPVLPVGFQIAEAIRFHHPLSRKAAMDRARALMELVRIPSAAERLTSYPHEFSGGMRQRVMIAIALACEPDVVIADEPTTALDVTIQAQVLALLADLQKARGVGLLLITHNLGVVASVADRVAVMYGGDLVELAPVAEFFAAPRHPYSRALLAAMPRLDRPEGLEPIPGMVPALVDMPAGCRFQSRCPLREDRCATLPPLADVADGHGVRCVRAGE
jgi:peptide/nickel transport system ATP-binding protein